ncbi:hypothetical protein P9265_21975 [Schinkia azotoformans]|uniref:hypothetical protein n=1 Tax=Schinkia azotoformans TaxID=1454 RepID=UPI002E1C094C|nr:hypothetical protein [Schinkia azotoformans]
MTLIPSNLSYSYFVLWIIIIILSIGVLKLFIAGNNPDMRPLHKQNTGILKGTLFPFKTFRNTKNEEINLNTKNGSILLFTSAGCGACKSLYPHLESFNKSYPDLLLVLIIQGSNDAIELLIDNHSLQNIKIVRSTSSLLQESKIEVFPFAYYVSHNGIVLSKGLINNVEQLFTLVKEGLIYKKQMRKEVV